MSEERYGENVRPWPELGYYYDYRRVFDGFVVAEDDGVTLPAWPECPYFLWVYATGDVGEVWRWEVACFTWMPFGDYLDPVLSGTAASIVRAVAEGKRAMTRLVVERENRVRAARAR